MTVTFCADHDPSLKAFVIGHHELAYNDGASKEDDRPAFVRAASGLSAYREYLAVVQDDANWLALIDADQQVTAVPLPPSPHGDRVFSASRGNQDDKYDLEACVAVEGPEGLELVGFSSGSRRGREYVLRVREKEGSAHHLAGRLVAEFVPAKAFYEAMRQRPEFSGSGLNIEGALALEGDTVRLFQRGNAELCGELEAVDATADFSWSELCSHLSLPDEKPAPELFNIRRYDLGELEGVRLTFSDAEHLGEGRVLYSASAEVAESGAIMGSVLGVIEAGGAARWTALTDENGEPFRGKIEGLTRDLNDSFLIHFVIDEDDENSASKVYKARITPNFLERR